MGDAATIAEAQNATLTTVLNQLWGEDRCAVAISDAPDVDIIGPTSIQKWAASYCCDHPREADRIVIGGSAAMLTRAVILLLPAMVHGSGALDGKRVLITGGGRGIGRAMATICAREGASHVAVLARSAGELEDVTATADEHGTKFLARTVDVTEDIDVDAAIAELASDMGGIDVLINNAGNSCTKAAMHEQSAAEFRALLDLNVVAVLSVTSAVLRHAMLGQNAGHIINVSSRAGKIGIANMGPYVASKFAVEGLTATLAEELKDRPQIRVNSISPGMVNTRAFPKAPGRPGVRPAESVREGLLAILRSGRSGTYLHVDEYDTAMAAGLPDLALKPINEPSFDAACAAASSQSTKED